MINEDNVFVFIRNTLLSNICVKAKKWINISPWIYPSARIQKKLYAHKSYNLSCLYLLITINSFPFLCAERDSRDSIFVVQTTLLFGTQRWRQRWCLNNRRKHAKVEEAANKENTEDPSRTTYWRKSSLMLK